ncbi:cbb3-type cytochrome c oxidase subunit 3 [Caulobacter segnis]|uniref:CcoQ/FixQ family Cbb3-type cytochrome c oxidase assembly chaperone n=1 Tax=Caulobacter segnis TaxID=88688 RepID=A0A2W5V2H0_9CAUL|nr:cbb3-type cytochrome c oxidase subunit 3 [Caulobacter segnis]PZR30886.1 MAG: CcoQ/FixQ family Cbb3-type cytochrome c oxidase assembly chaperone [Caulobacter segnis]
MSGLSYETVARFAQQGGLVYFGLIFLAGVAYALWPSRKAEFQHAAHMPLDDEELS